LTVRKISDREVELLEEVQLLKDRIVSGTIMSRLLQEYGSEIAQILAQYPEGRSKSAVLPLMHLAQELYGCINEEAKQDVAAILGLDPTHILSLAGFYTLFHEEAHGRYVLEICDDLACALRGGDDFLKMACRKLGIENHGTSADGLFTIHNVMCIGACDRAPVLQCNLKFHESLDEEKFDALIAALRAEAASGEATPSVVERVIALRPA
jgi:NADH-quinone oxidoreductase subunit E